MIPVDALKRVKNLGGLDKFNALWGTHLLGLQISVAEGLPNMTFLL